MFRYQSRTITSINAKNNVHKANGTRINAINGNQNNNLKALCNLTTFSIIEVSCGILLLGNAKKSNGQIMFVTSDFGRRFNFHSRNKCIKSLNKPQYSVWYVL